MTRSRLSSWGRPGARTGRDGPRGFIARNNAGLRERRDLVVAMLNRADGLTCREPEGTFSVLPSCEGVIGRTTPKGKMIESDEDFAAHLLRFAVRAGSIARRRPDAFHSAL